MPAVAHKIGGAISFTRETLINALFRERMSFVIHLMFLTINTVPLLHVD